MCVSVWSGKFLPHLDFTQSLGVQVEALKTILVVLLIEIRGIIRWAYVGTNRCMLVLRATQQD